VGTGAGEERLNAEFVGGDASGGEVTLGAGAGADGMDRSRRSFIPLAAGAAGLDGAGEEKALKSAKPPAGLIVRLCDWFCGAGLESKKLPPPPNMFDDEAVGGDFALEKLSRPENGEGFGAGAALKDRLLNASFMPPKADCCGDACPWGDASPPKESWRACCCGWAGAAGFEAYSDRIDCLRSGLDAAAAAGPVLDGRAGGAEDDPPRKSNPNNESPALFCFGGAVSGLEGPLAPTGGPVLGR
jgi:hypothetical protein